MSACYGADAVEPYQAANDAARGRNRHTDPPDAYA